MPVPPKNRRTLEVENKLADRLGYLRRQQGLTYEGLAHRMKAVGCDIHASGIQKTEKSGRRITVDELVAYSQVFDCSIDSLLGHREQGTDIAAGMSAFGSARRLNKIRALVNDEYRLAIETLWQQVQDNPALREQIEDRLNTEKALLVQERFDGEDVELNQLDDSFWADNESPTLATAWDVLKEEIDG